MRKTRPGHHPAGWRRPSARRRPPRSRAREESGPQPPSLGHKRIQLVHRGIEIRVAKLERLGFEEPSKGNFLLLVNILVVQRKRRDKPPQRFARVERPQ